MIPESWREFGIPALAAFLFLLIESAGNFPESALTAFIICTALLMFAFKDNPGEPLLFFIGFLTGCAIEVGLRFLGYQQVWTQSSFFGIPYWLPVAWGLGFVLITRFGLVVRNKAKH